MLAKGLRVPWGIAFLPDGGGAGHRAGQRHGSSGRARVRADGLDGHHRCRRCRRGRGRRGRAARHRRLPGRTRRTGRSSSTTPPSTDNRIARLTTRRRPPHADPRPASPGPASTTAAGSPSARTAALRRHRRRRRARRRPGPERASAARSCGSRRTASRRRATRSPTRRSGRWGTATCRAWPGTPRKRMYATEFGQNTWDEINRIEPGRELRLADGRGRRPATQRFVDPIVQWATERGVLLRGWPRRTGCWSPPACAGERLWLVELTDTRHACSAQPERAVDHAYGRLRGGRRCPGRVALGHPPPTTTGGASPSRRRRPAAAASSSATAAPAGHSS